MNKMSETLKLIKSGLIKASRGELNLRACLKGGMSFRWTLDNEQQNFTEYTGIIGDKVVRLKQILDNNAIEYSVFANTDEEMDFEPVLNDYFRLNENLVDLYSYWSDRDEKFKEKVGNHADVLGGIRVLRIDPVENLFSFICSSNNGIPRITQMVANLCIHFGKLIGQMSDGRSYYSFPSIESLTKKGVDLKLRELKFGYRARFIHDAASYIHKKTDGEGEKWLHSLRERPYEEVHAELVKIPGVGKKVADCICLMSMDKLEAIPVDTHVFQMAKNYGFVKLDKQRDTKKGSNSLSDSSYREIANKFRELWDKYAGWAQTVMFVDDLREFKQLQKSKSDLKLEEAKKEPLENDKKTTSSNSNKRSGADQQSTAESSRRKKKLKS